MPYTKTDYPVSMKNLHKEDLFVSPVENGWVIKKEKGKILFEKFDTKKDAVAKARKLMKTHHGSLTVQRKNGRIETRQSYTQ